MDEKILQEVVAKAIAAHGAQENKLLELLLNPVVITALCAGVAVIIGAIAAAVVVVIKGIRDAKQELKKDIADNTDLTVASKEAASKAVVVAEDKANENQKALNGRLTQLLAMTAEAEYAKGLANGVHNTIVKQVAEDKETNDKNFREIRETLGVILVRLDALDQRKQASDERQKAMDDRITRHSENNRLQTELNQQQIEELNKRLARVTQIVPENPNG